jgi:hypothetical protein
LRTARLQGLDISGNNLDDDVLFSFVEVLNVIILFLSSLFVYVLLKTRIPLFRLRKKHLSTFFCMVFHLGRALNELIWNCYKR